MENVNEFPKGTPSGLECKKQKKNTHIKKVD